MAQKTKKRARFVINMVTGAHGPRTAATDELPLTFKLIDDATCKALATGEITGMQVVEAVKKDMMSKPDFSWEEYDRRRQAEKLRMNVSQHEMVPATVGDEKGETAEVSEEVISLDSINVSAAGASKKPPKGASELDKALLGI